MTTAADHLRRAGWQLRAAGNLLGEAPPAGGLLVRPTLDELNEAIYDLYANFNGGRILVDGVNEDLDYDGPVVMLPNVQLIGVGGATMYTPSRTRIKPVHAGPIFLFDDGAVHGTGNREAWGGSYLRSFGVVPSGDGRGTVIQCVGGNGARIQDVMAEHVGGRSFEYGVHISEGRGYDSQYSTFDRVRLPRVDNGFVAERGAPDCVVNECLFYGGDKVGSRGLYLAQGAGGTSSSAHNFEFTHTHFQFFDVGHDIATSEVTLRDGSWENHSSYSGPLLTAATILRSTARDVIIDGVSYANWDSVKRTFVFEPGATFFPIRFTGHRSRVRQEFGEDYSQYFEAPVTAT